MPAADPVALPGVVELTCAFGFDAAHRFANPAMGEENRRIHGHSFQVEVTVSGLPDPETGFVVDFRSFEAALEETRAMLDHRLLNDLPGLSVPSLENLARWIWGRLAPDLPGLNRVAVSRPTLRQSCTYRGP